MLKTPVLVQSLKLSNVSTWMGDRLGIHGAAVQQSFYASWQVGWPKPVLTVLPSQIGTCLAT